MIALLIGGTVVLCMGLLAVVYGVPIKEFSFGNTMILAGSIVACTGLMLIGLSVVGRELKNLTRRLENGVAPAVPVEMPVALPAARPAAAPRELPQDLAKDAAPEMPAVRPPLRSPPDREDTLFASEQPFEPEQDRFYVDRRSDPARDQSSSLEAPASAPAKPAERVRRNIMFSSHRRDSKNLDSRDESQTDFDASDEQSPSDDVRNRDSGNAFAAAWPQSSRSRSEPPVSQSGRIASSLTEPDDQPEPQRERFQPPRKADASPVSIVKSGVVDSMAYSLYSDGSIEAQMPEGMVRFASIDELRAHLDQRN